MHHTHGIRGLAALTAVLTVLLGEVGLAQSPLGDRASGPQGPAQAPPVMDVAMSRGGMFGGQAVDARGSAQASAVVVLLQGGHEVGQVVADRRGMFQFGGVRGGVYEVSTAGSTVPVRLWAEGSAPPAARPGLLLVNNSDVVAGQDASSQVWQAVRSPWVSAGVISAAIAVPIALRNNAPGS